MGIFVKTMRLINNEKKINVLFWFKVKYIFLDDEKIFFCFFSLGYYSHVGLVGVDCIL